MRVPTITLYRTSMFQLNTLTNNLNDANEVIATQKKINSISDDPIGVTQVLDISQSIENIEQLGTNIDMGITWINTVETALNSIQDQLLETKLLCTQLANASVSASERTDAVETIEGIIDQILALGNTQVNGAYVFSGTKTNVLPFSYDEESASGVIYNGNDTAFAIQTSTTSTLEVGRVGQDVFTENNIRIDTTNNTLFLTEDPGMGLSSMKVLQATIPEGNFTPQELAVLVKNAMNLASEESGYQVTYEVEYNTETNRFSFSDDGTTDGYFGFDLLWESGETPRISGINTEGILAEDVDINIVNDNALIYETPDPEGSAPLRLTFNSDGRWEILNDPGYDLPLEIDGSSSHVSLDLDKDGIGDLEISLESEASAGDYIEFDIIKGTSDTSIGPDLGFSGDVSYQPPHSDFHVTLKSFDDTNNVIDFKEHTDSGSSDQLSAAIPPGDYSDLSELSQAIEEAMEEASVNGVDYVVSYSETTNKFTISDNGGSLDTLELLWKTGTNASTSAGSELGYDPTLGDDTDEVSYTGDSPVTLFEIVEGVNDTIDLKEILAGSGSSAVSEFSAVIAHGSYTDIDSFARAVEDALEDASEQNGNRINYAVTYNEFTRGFTIKEDGGTGEKLESLELLWGTGQNTSTSAATTLGFLQEDKVSSPVQGETVSYGIFETLSALKDYFANDDIAGIQRTMTRLDTHYNSMTSILSDSGMKYNRLTTTEQILININFSLTERKSMIEDADIVESIMELESIQTAYEAALNTTSKIISLSLADYL